MLQKFNFQSTTLLSLCLPSSDVPHTEGSRVEVSTEVKHLWRKMFVKDMFSSYLAADSCTTGF